jgi:hypothetical protein
MADSIMDAVPEIGLGTMTKNISLVDKRSNAKNEI